MTRCGVLLHPASHTLSPALHRAAYDELGLDARYDVYDIAPEALEARVAELRSEGITQLSVSIPHKEAVVPLADSISDAVETIGAANTLTLRDGRLDADNTDWIGVLRTLEPLGPWKGKEALVVGAGGAARAAVYALGRLGLHVRVTNRNVARAARLAEQLGAWVGTPGDDYDLLVNATPVGMHPDADASPVPRDALRPGTTVLDAVYRPLETRLLREARERGCRTQDGLDWLVHQAVEQVRLWSDREPSAARMREAALEELGRP